MFASNKFLILVLLLLTAYAGLINTAQAQTDSAFDDIPLNGLASFVQLRKEYYIGGLYLESLNKNSGAVFSFSGRKRMELRITIDEWSPRRFSQQWNQAILINNSQESLEEFANDILAFVDLPKGDLVAGDRITIDLDPNRGTSVYLNSQLMFRVKNNDFFDVLLNTWIGQRPPSSDFKNDILTLPTDQAGTDLLTRYEANIPTREREKKVAGWRPESADKPTAAKTAAAVAAASASAAAAPPGAGTTAVTAKRSSADTSKSESLAAGAPVTATAIAAPKLEMEKPKLNSAPLNSSTSAPVKSEPKPEPKPAPKEVAKSEPKPAAKKAGSDDDQEGLLHIYRSNVLKLTYLNTQYPRKAINFNQEGLVVLKVVINRQGDIEEMIEESSSGHRLLDKAAKDAVNKSKPYPKIPDNLKGKTVEISLPFNFQL